ncbi:snf2 domain-containing protein classy 3 [Phtheirospermum japonicum]|uniref:Snf2 domain-containing protein classy 3 n=1 Tax=Phtheirospermum japonicum TaxID=374723 RepID=A0A830BW27_9LAMI|nr:snf2 domain-containing protein classy 3 [Phtheirospermum japonicum]
MKLFPNCRPVIIAPAGMLLTWEEEFRKWNVEFPFINLNHTEVCNKEKKIALGLLSGPKRRDMNTTRMVQSVHVEPRWGRPGNQLQPVRVREADRRK